MKKIIEYIKETFKRTRYEMFEEQEPFYGEVASLKGVLATGKTLEECKERLGEGSGPIEKRLAHSLSGLVSDHPQKELSVRG